MEQKIRIDGKEYRMRASALIPRLYRSRFGRDLIQDLRKVEADIKKDDFNAECFEDLLYLMIRHADKTQAPDTVEEWLDTFDDTAAIIQALPEALTYWMNSNKTTSKPRKK